MFLRSRTQSGCSRISKAPRCSAVACLSERTWSVDIPSGADQNVEHFVQIPRFRIRRVLNLNITADGRFLEELAGRVSTPATRCLKSSV